MHIPDKELSTYKNDKVLASAIYGLEAGIRRPIEDSQLWPKRSSKAQANLIRVLQTSRLLPRGDRYQPRWYPFYCNRIARAYSLNNLCLYKVFGVLPIDLNARLTQTLRYVGWSINIYMSHLTDHLERRNDSSTSQPQACRIHFRLRLYLCVHHLTSNELLSALTFAR